MAWIAPIARTARIACMARIAPVEQRRQLIARNA